MVIAQSTQPCFRKKKSTTGISAVSAHKRLEERVHSEKQDAAAACLDHSRARASVRGPAGVSVSCWFTR